MEIATRHTDKLMTTDHYNSMWTPQPCKCLHHTWAELHPAQPFKCYYCHHHYQFWHKPSVPSTQCPFLRVTEQQWWYQVMTSWEPSYAATTSHPSTWKVESWYVVQPRGNHCNATENQSIAQCNKTWYIHCCCLWHLVLIWWQYACLHQSPE